MRLPRTFVALSLIGALPVCAAGRTGAYRVFLPGAAKSWKPAVQADETTFEEFQQGVW